MSEVTASEVAQNLDVADEKAKYDASARKLVAQKSILAYILKSALDEFADIPVKRIAGEFIEGTPQISEVAVHQDHPDAACSRELREMLNGSDRIEGMPTEDVSVKEGTVRYDIRFMVQVPGGDDRMEIIVNIEIQNKDTPGYPIPKRGIYYGSRLISAQRGKVFKDQEYDRIKKVASIWICEDTAVERSDVINEYRFVELCKRGEYREAEANYDLMRIVVMRLGQEGEQSGDDAIRLLSKVFSTERSAEEKKTVLSDEFHIEVTEEISQEVSQVCNLSTGIYDKGVRQGIQEGIQEGIQKGIQEGKREGALEILFGLVKDNLLSIADAAKRANIERSVFEKEYMAYMK